MKKIFIWLLFLLCIENFKPAGNELHPRFYKLANKYQTLINYFAKSKVKVISKDLVNGTIQKQFVYFDIGYSTEKKNLFFEKSHIKSINSEQNINIISNGKYIYKHILPLNQYTKRSLKNKNAIFESINDISLTMIFAPEKIFNDIPKSIKIASLKYKLFESSSHEILYIKSKSSKELFLLILYIQKASGLLDRWSLKTIHQHDKHKIIQSILISRYYNIHYNEEKISTDGLFTFTPSKESQLVDEFDIEKYYYMVKEKLNSFLAKKVEFPQITYINSDKNDSQSKPQFYLLEFWATWCSICRNEISLLNSIEKKFHGRIEIIGISYEKITTIKNFMKSITKKIQYKIAHYDLNGAKEPFKLVAQYPTTFLLDNKYVIKKVWVGEKDRDEFMNYLEKLFKK